MINPSVLRRVQRELQQVGLQMNQSMSTVLCQSVFGISKEMLNKHNFCQGIQAAWNRPQNAPIEWDRWAKEWSEVFARSPHLDRGDWSQTIFVTGLYYSGSSAVADCLYDSLEIWPPPRETVGFRRRRLPAAMDDPKQFRQFFLKSVLGASANPRDRSHAWLPHAMNSGLEHQTFAESILGKSPDSSAIGAQQLARAFLAPASAPLVLDNALVRKSLDVSEQYPGAKWILVVRDLPSQFAQICIQHGYDKSPVEFGNFVASSLSRAMRDLSGLDVIVASFDLFVLETKYRQKLINRIVPGLTVKSGNLFVPDQSAHNTHLGHLLAESDRRFLEHLQASLYAQLPL